MLCVWGMFKYVFFVEGVCYLNIGFEGGGGVGGGGRVCSVFLSLFLGDLDG